MFSSSQTDGWQQQLPLCQQQLVLQTLQPAETFSCAQTFREKPAEERRHVHAQTRAHPSQWDVFLLFLIPVGLVSLTKGDACSRPH